MFMHVYVLVISPLLIHVHYARFDIVEKSVLSVENFTCYTNVCSKLSFIIKEILGYIYGFLFFILMPFCNSNVAIYHSAPLCDMVNQIHKL